MSSVLYRFGRWCYRARKMVLALWIVIFVAFAVLYAAFGGQTDDSFQIPGTESQEALDQLSGTFPQVSGASGQVIVVTQPGDSVTIDAIEESVSTFVKKIETLPDVAAVTSPFEPPQVEGTKQPISDDGEAALISVQLTDSSANVSADSKNALIDEVDVLNEALPEGVVATAGGDAFSVSIPELSITEAIGVLIAFVVLIITFGSLRLAGMPLASGVFGALVSIVLIMLGTILMPISSTTPMLALMLGLAVGIDYALFILSRHQEQLKHGMDPEESAAQSVATAGSAVVFAGMTVIIALLGLAVAQIPFLTVMGVGASVAVAVAVVVALSLIPAMLGFAGIKALSKRSRKALTKKDYAPKQSRFFSGWITAATKFPIVTMVIIIVGLALFAIPATSLRLALPDAGYLPEENQARVTYEEIADHFGPGQNGPLLVTGTIVTSTDPLGLMADLAEEMRALPGVAEVPLSTPNETADTGIIQVIPTDGPNSETTKEVVQEIRDKQDYFKETYGVDLAVTGFTAIGIDVSSRLGEALIPFGIVVVGLSILLLLMVFRSIVVPIKATLGYLLSVVAAFGVVSMVFEWGWLADFIGVDKTGPVISFFPIILMGVLFGLAMDYEVFLVSRMREEYVHGAGAAAAVRKGFMGTAKVVTAAAVIMFAVFAAFIPSGDSSIKPIALGLAVGVFVDAFIVRMTLVPAVLALLGDKAWWMPKWLDRALPSLDVEGEGVQREISLQDWPEPNSSAVIAAAELELDRAREDDLVYRHINLRVDPGEHLLIHGSDPFGVSQLLFALSGRSQPADGILKVAGYLTPSRMPAIRRQCAYIRADGSAASLQRIKELIAEQPRILIIDHLPAFVENERDEELAQILTEAFAARLATGKELTLVLGLGHAPESLVPDFVRNWSLPGRPVTYRLSPPEEPGLAGSAEPAVLAGAAETGSEDAS